MNKIILFDLDGTLIDSTNAIVSTFYHSFKELNYDLVEIQKRWKNLMSRHQESKKVIDLPVLTTAETQEINIPEMASQVMIESELNRHLNMLTVNYFVSQIEMHKLLYSDPYQYADELKRIKNFNSSGQAIMNSSPKMNKLYNNVWNKGFKKGSIGYTNFTQEYFKTATHEDVIGIVDLPNYEEYKETDGGGIMIFNAYRNYRIRASDWNTAEEAQYRYDVAWEKRDKNVELSKEEEALLLAGNPQVKSAYTPLKPIVRGNKANGKNYNDVVLDKFALYPLSYRLMKQINPTSNAVSLYAKMQNEKIDYIVYNSSRKVGADQAHPTYNAKGEFNNAPYAKRTIVNVPFSIMDVQTEVPSKDISLVTRGSQVTKLITMDFMDAGVPIDFVLEDAEFIIPTKDLKHAVSIHGRPITCNIPPNPSKGYVIKLDKVFEIVQELSR
jgi:hypothetical protein